jgi:hypothetical protein
MLGSAAAASDLWHLNLMARTVAQVVVKLPPALDVL